METLILNVAPHQRVFFTSDHHFSHKNVIRFCGRPYESTSGMNADLIHRWNEVVGDDDYVFSLGDMFWTNSKLEVLKIVDKLHGHKNLILGNHGSVRQMENCMDKVRVLSDITLLILRFQKDDPRVMDGKWEYEVVLSHYPLTCYSQSDRGAYQFFGHIHSRKGQPMMEFGEPIPLRSEKYMDVGVDRFDYRPVEFFDVLNAIQDYPFWERHKIKKVAE